MKKNTDDRPAEEAVAVQEQTVAPEGAAEATAQPQPSKKESRIAKISFVWTIISMIFAIASGVTLISKNWILAPYSYIMLGFLAAYVIVFVVVVALNAKDSKAGKARVKNLKKLFGIFKIVTTLVFLIVTAMSMVGVVQADTVKGLWKWIVIGANISIAGVQLGLKITLLILKAIFKKKGKQYAVRVSTYVNGLRKENSVGTAVRAKLYETEKVEDGTVPAPAEAAAIEGTKAAEIPAAGTTAVSAERRTEEGRKQPSAAEKIKLSGQKAKEYAAIAKEHAARAIADMKAVGRNGEASKTAQATDAAADRESAGTSDGTVKSKFARKTKGDK